MLDNFSLEIEENEFVCIMGPSGSGKSTILNIMGLLEKPVSGNISICGLLNPRLNSRRGIYLLRNNISYLFQNYGLIESETVKYNVGIAARYLQLSKKEKNKAIEKALERVGLKNMEHEKIYCLSGGEQQRAALAKNILKPSTIILADEPTGSLDDGNRDLVMGIIHDLNKEGKTVVLVTHDTEIEQYATRTVKLPMC